MNEMVEFKGATLADLFPRGQIKLAEISVYNWGSFAGLHTVKINSSGTLITGDNGAGKSTLIDAIFALMLPAGKAAFNVAAAQGDIDRTLMTYIRGNYGSAHDGSGIATLAKRNGATATALRAMYRCDDGSVVTLAALFWTLKPGNSLIDLKRQYFVAQRDLTLEEILSHFGDGNIRALRKHYDDDASVIPKESFTDYEELFLRALCMENRKAPALLARAMGLKKVDDLTDLIRKLVLEPSAVRDKARKLVMEFDDLVSIHDQLEDARRQRDCLAPLPQLSSTLSEQQKRVSQLKRGLDGIAPYFGEMAAALWCQRIEALNQELTDFRNDLEGKHKQEAANAEILVQLRVAYQQSGGDRLDGLKGRLKEAQTQLTLVVQCARAFQATARALGVNEELSEINLRHAQHAAEAIITALPERVEQAKQNQEQILFEKVRDENHCRELREEIQETEKRPHSGIDSRYQNLRDRISRELTLSKDQLMFIGELIDMRDDTRDWQGAVERALGGLRLTMVIDSTRVSDVTRWLNANHTGLHIRLLTADTIKNAADFWRDGFLVKLQWRDHPYQQWLKAFLGRHDLHCVADVAALNATPFSLTIQGLIQREKGRFEKNDKYDINNRREWAIGFSSRHRLEALREELVLVASRLADHQRLALEISETLLGLDRERKMCEELIAYTYDQIDVDGTRTQIELLEAAIADLQERDSDLRKAKEQLERAQLALEVLRDHLGELRERIGAKERDVENADAARSQASKQADCGIDDDIREMLRQMVPSLSLDDLEQAAELERHARSSLDDDYSAAQSKVNDARQDAQAIISHFYAKWEVIANDWGKNVDAIDDYIHHLKGLMEEGLPDLAERFRETLNRNTTQSLANLRSSIEAEREEINDRIDVINSVLRRTEFRHGTYLQLGSQREDFKHVTQFNRDVISVLAQATSDDHEKRFQDLKAVIDTLDRATNSATADNQESLRLLDARYQLSFYAEDRSKADNHVIDVLDSSSGKSGGEKESFAGNIVAASLAYVLTPEGCSRPMYCTVFLDEAFSNTAEAVSRRVLRVFKELDLHLNLITPFKNLNIARETANSLIIAERDADKHESRLSEVTWEIIDKRIADGLIRFDD